MNIYEKSKLEAETIVNKYTGNAKVVILRPTNVISRAKNNVRDLSALKVFVKGGENTHLVHAFEVAAAALYFAKHPPVRSHECYIVSCDEHSMNTIGGRVTRVRSGTLLPNWQRLDLNFRWDS